MKIEEQFFVIKNLTTGRFVFNSSQHTHTIPAFTKVLPDAQCFETIEHAEKAINRIKAFYKAQESIKASDELLIFQLTRTHTITKEFHP
ncbi:hypothetical protein HYG89_06435 [Acinetobacter sp. SwsAc5]|uniref:hypothetical protein n=1 Tax=Acinetobacter sp. SwsAc5 TaxID=2749438 RepID=UPI0015C0E4BE|nr:hypothetical protein [Acinetobacter sp. SwsAc5]NWK52198.1 hypothetical protein [Acinetobacter sp. SwsAc5]